MSYTCTVYATSASIANTIVEIYDASTDNLNARYTIAYDGDNSGHDLDIHDDEVLEFSVELASGATFTQWVYRSAIDDYAQRTSTNTVFRYTNRMNIQIRADGTGGGGGGGNWTSVYVGSDVYQNSYDSSFSISEKQMRTIRIQFTNAGTATFTGSSNQNIYAYLSDTSTYSQANGVPTGAILISDTSESASFSMQYSVTTGVTYYLWVRYASASASGNASVTITPPSGGGGGGWSTYTPYIYNGLQWVQATAYVYNGSQWVQATPNIQS